MTKITDIRKRTADDGIICKINGATVTIDCDFVAIDYNERRFTREGTVTTNVCVRDTYSITESKDTPFMLSERMINGHPTPWEYETHPSFATLPDSHAIFAYKDSKNICSIWF